MPIFKELIQGDDMQESPAIITSGVWQDGASNITAFYTSSTQSGSTGDYHLNVYRYSPANNASASIQLGISYGHREGSGSLGTVGATGERPSAAVFGQFNSLINPPNTTTFTFSSKTDAVQIYALTFNRARIREKLDPGTWELHLKKAKNVVKLIDDSSTNKGGNTNQRNFSPEYNIVSGTVAGGTTINEAATAQGSALGSYGSFYPSLGVLILNPYRLWQGQAPVTTTSASNTNNWNNQQLFHAIESGSYFTARRQEEITSRHYFCRAHSSEFNATTNETYYTQSVAGVKQIISQFQSDPKVYITCVGLYNSDNELLAIAKLSKPILKSKSREALIKVKLDF
jgi:hypothetical protein|tara:strand:+ start:16925 stop:17953 length:1029 start_codon:yes stop_codon:yes gene_type:complete